MSNKRLTILIITIFLGGIVSGFIFGMINGYFLKKNIDNKLLNNNTNSNINKLVASNNTHIAYNKQKKNQDGTITEINKNQIKIQGKSLINNEEKEIIFTLNINDQTKIIEFDKSIEPNTQRNISLSDLKIGDRITALSNEVIDDKTEFTAIRINHYINQDQ